MKLPSGCRNSRQPMSHGLTARSEQHRADVASSNFPSSLQLCHSRSHLINSCGALSMVGSTSTARTPSVRSSQFGGSIVIAEIQTPFFGYESLQVIKVHYKEKGECTKQGSLELKCSNHDTMIDS